MRVWRKAKTLLESLYSYFPLGHITSLPYMACYYFQWPCATWLWFALTFLVFNYGKSFPVVTVCSPMTDHVSSVCVCVCVRYKVVVRSVIAGVCAVAGCCIMLMYVSVYLECWVWCWMEQWSWGCGAYGIIHCVLFWLGEFSILRLVQCVVTRKCVFEWGAWQIDNVMWRWHIRMYINVTMLNEGGQTR